MACGHGACRSRWRAPERERGALGLALPRFVALVALPPRFPALHRGGGGAGFVRRELRESCRASTGWFVRKGEPRSAARWSAPEPQSRTRQCSPRTPSAPAPSPSCRSPWPGLPPRPRSGTSTTKPLPRTSSAAPSRSATLAGGNFQSSSPAWFDPAAGWAEAAGSRALLEREREAALLLEGALEAARQGAWSTAVARGERLLGDLRNTLLVRSLSRGGPWLEPPPLPQPEPEPSAPAAAGGEPAEGSATGAGTKAGQGAGEPGAGPGGDPGGEAGAPEEGPAHACRALGHRVSPPR